MVRLWIAAPHLRLGAAAIDLLILYAIAWVTESSAELFNTRGDEVLAVLPGFLYFWLLHARWGQTVGKRIVGIMVVSPHTGLPPSLRSSAIRAGFSVGIPLIPMFGWLIGLIDKFHLFLNGRRQCYHDKFADTVVVLVPPKAATT
ncbi:hypothetical protein Misp02_66060 [Microtetraspora sp. NBRC 16547]|nr:hypothetical protein Misp02_66060 [Microtetraspora sp. NBRC 16547]